MPFVSSVRGSFGLPKRPFPKLFINNSNSSITGGSITTAGGYRIHRFDYTGGNQTFAFSYGGGTVNGATISFPVEYLIVAGGGSGGNLGGGGGGGGLLSGSADLSSSTSYTIFVGAGANPPGAESSNHANSGNQGGNSTFLGLTAVGGGFGARYNTGNAAGTGGSGGGGGAHQSGGGGGAGGVGENARLGSNVNGNIGGNPTTGQGYKGGDAFQSDYPTTCTGGQRPGNGGPGLASSITGTSVTYAGGGGGGCYKTSARAEGGVGGGGHGGTDSACANINGGAGTNGLGGGGGGSGHQGGTNQGGAGGHGVVIVRYAL